MKLLYDTTAIRWGSAGVSTYARHLRKALLELERAPQLCDTAPPWSFPHNGHPLQKVDTAVTDTLWRPFLLPLEARIRKADLVHMLYPRPFPLSLHRKPVVATVHDLYALEHPEIFSAWEQRCNRNLVSFLQGLRQILTVSEFTRNELIRVFPKLDPSLIHVTHNGFDAERFRPVTHENLNGLRQKLKLEKPYFLFVSTLEPRKNVLTLLDAFIDSGLGDDFDLLLAGGDGWVPEYIRQIKTKIEKYDSIRRLGFVPADDLPALYAGARAFVYPSHYEGFGIPVLEAMACECPVICSSGSSLDEISAGAALQIDSSQTEGLIEALKKVANDDSLVSKMKTMGIQQTKNFSWEKCANQTLNAYRRVVSQ
jgi:alpha-1,3-rhamnosyl/mannosyltransferase